MTGAVYTDFSQFAQLRVEAQGNPNAALEETAEQFEALFIQMMLKSMRDSVEESELFGSDQLDTYQQMADKQLSLELSRQGGIGIARALVEQMQTRGYVTGSDAEAVTPVTDPAVNGTGLPISGIDTLKLQASPAANTFTVDKRA